MSSRAYVGASRHYCRMHRLYKNILHVLLFAFVHSLDSGPDVAFAQTEAKQPPQALNLPARPSGSGRITLAPWRIRVLGKPYQDFDQEAAAHVLLGWLTNELLEIKVFDVVNREDLERVLDELGLRIVSEDQEVSETQLAQAGRIIRADYIILGSFTNFGQSSQSQVDFKLLDVETSTYSSRFRLNFRVPFNPAIENVQPVIERIVAELSAQFPVETRVREALGPNRIVIEGGRSRGLQEFVQVEFWQQNAHEPISTGVVTRVHEYTAEVELEKPIPVVLTSTILAKVRTSPGAEAILTMARLRQSRGKGLEARAILERGLARYPQNSRLLSEHARSCWLLHDYAAAIPSFRKAIELEPNDSSLLEDGTAAMLEAGEFLEVIQHLAHRERSTAMSIHLGKANEAFGYWQRARNAFKEAFRGDPNATAPHLRLAILAFKAGNLDEASRELATAERFAPDSLDVKLVGQTMQVLTTDGSEEDARKILRPHITAARNAAAFTAIVSAGELLATRPSLTSLVHELARVSLEVNPGYLAGLLLMSKAYALADDLEQALAVLEKELARKPNNVALLVESARLLDRREDLVLAERRLLQAKDLAPDFWHPADVLGDLLFARSRYLESLREYLYAQQTAERTGEPDLTTRLLKLGRAAALASQYSTAQPYLERCVGHAPDHLGCRYYLGLSYFHFQLDEMDVRAAINLKAVADATPDIRPDRLAADSNYFLGVLHERGERYSEAVDRYRLCAQAECTERERSQERIEAIESIKGNVTTSSNISKLVSLDIGRIHGVLPGQVGIVLSGNQIKGNVLLVEVHEKTSTAKIKSGEILVGHEVRIRPPRPREFTAALMKPKGVRLRWKKSRNPEVDKYILYRRLSGEQQWNVRAKISRDKTHYHDKAVKPGRTYLYQVTADSGKAQESLPSFPVEMEIPQKK